MFRDGPVRVANETRARSAFLPSPGRRAGTSPAVVCVYQVRPWSIELRRLEQHERVVRVEGLRPAVPARSVASEPHVCHVLSRSGCPKSVPPSRTAAWTPLPVKPASHAPVKLCVLASSAFSSLSVVEVRRLERRRLGVRAPTSSGIGQRRVARLLVRLLADLGVEAVRLTRLLEVDRLDRRDALDARELRELLGADLADDQREAVVGSGVVVAEQLLHRGDVAVLERDEDADAGGRAAVQLLLEARSRASSSLRRPSCERWPASSAFGPGAALVVAVSATATTDAATSNA